MMDMEDHLGNDYSILLDQPDPILNEEPIQPTKETTKDNREPQEKNWWKLEFYQRFFDVTSSDVLGRVAAAITSLSSSNFPSNLNENPDLYGPFWTCITLAIEMGLMSNASYYFFHYGSRSWRQTIRTVYQAAVLLFLYCWCFPTLLWIGLEWNPVSTYKFRLLELWCVYGYAASVLVPAATIWALPVIWLRWIFATLAVAFSGIFICRALKKVFGQLDYKTHFALQTMFFSVNALVVFSFVVLFFPHKFQSDGKLTDHSPQPVIQIFSSAESIASANKTAPQNFSTVEDAKPHNSSQF